jgi:membrane protein required for colicin V production
MLGILAVAAVIGFFKGFVWQLAWIVGIVVSGFVAIRFGGVVAPYFGQQPPWNRLVAMLALYAASSVGVGFFFKLVAGLIDKVHLSSFDHQLGLVFGAAKGLLMCIVVTFFAVTLAPDYRPQIVGSRSGRIMADLIVRADSLLPPDIHELVEPFIRQFEEKLGSPAGAVGQGADPVAVSGSGSGEKSPLAALWQGVTSAAAWGGVDEPAASVGASAPAAAAVAAVPRPEMAPPAGLPPAARVAGGYPLSTAPPVDSPAGPGGSSFGQGGPGPIPPSGAGGQPPQSSPFQPAALQPGMSPPSPPAAMPPAAPVMPSAPPFGSAAGLPGMAPPGPFPAGSQTPLPPR